MMRDSVGICYAYSTHGYYRTQWLCNVTAFAPTLTFERGLPDDVANPEGIISVRTAEDLPRDHELVVLSPLTARIVRPTIALQDFEHPARAVYLFGSDMTFLSEVELGGRVPDHVVYVPVASQRECDEVYSFVIGALVLYDRSQRRSWRS
jgi:hypothetical protein